MEVVVKLSKSSYRRLRGHVPADCAAYEPMEKATAFEHSMEGVLFAGYTIACDDRQARALLEIARRHCPEAIAEIEKTLAAAAARR
jgi:hypothetical protein